MGKSVAEKILSAKSGKDARAGETVICPVDFLMCSDTTAPMAIKAFKSMGGSNVACPENIAFVIDHAAPCPNQRIAQLHQMMRSFAEEQGIRLFEQGEGICHQLIYENGLVKAGDLVMGADSHTCTYGGLGALATGVGSTDLAAAMLTGCSWFKVPKTTRVVLKGNFPGGVYPKDLMLYLVGRFGSDGQNYNSIEFYGEVFDTMPISDKLSMCNMAIEAGAKFGVICDKTTGIYSDEGVEFDEDIEIDLSELTPYVAKPHRVENAVPISQVEGTAVQQCFLGSCTNGRLEDLRIAAAILRGKKIAQGVRLIISPASKKVMLAAMNEGTLQSLMEAGGIVTVSGCGLCVGTLGGVPGDEDNVISCTNRNFQGRMGNPNANIYLASPATVATSALYGRITDPRGDKK